MWYSVLAIDDVLERNVSVNTQNKRDFPTDDKKLHLLMFAEIVQAIHEQGNGLTDIVYFNRNAQQRPLLTKSEVQHLEDVAKLIDDVHFTWWCNAFILFILVFVLFFTHDKNYLHWQIMPTAKQKWLSVVALLALLALLFMLFGFTDIFYYLHTVVFPANHQWFFYYNDSLMSSLMKAPDLFALIGIQLFIVAFVFTTCFDIILYKYQKSTLIKT